MIGGQVDSHERLTDRLTGKRKKPYALALTSWTSSQWATTTPSAANSIR
jgi:hypothetical protein